MKGSRSTFTARRPLSPHERQLDRPAQKRTMVQAIAAGLRIDHVARDAGYADGAAGERWDPGSLDVLSYAAGYVAGHQFGRGRQPAAPVHQVQTSEPLPETCGRTHTGTLAAAVSITPNRNQGD